MRAWGHSLRLLLGLSAVSLALGADPIHIRNDAQFQQALRTVKAGDTLSLAPNVYTLRNQVGTLRFEKAPVTITSEDGTDPARFDCLATCYVSGALNLRLEGLEIEGRMNFDGVSNFGSSGSISFIGNTFTSSPTQHKDILKIAHLTDITIRGNKFIRVGNGAKDRPLDVVNADRFIVENNYFENCNFGCIQIKGGSESILVTRNFLNGGGQRGIQIGGSTCWNAEKNEGCWGQRIDLSVVRPDDVGSEAIDSEVSHNIVIDPVACFALSTQRQSYVHHNTCYFSRRHGGMFFFRILQETEPQTAPLLLPNQDIRIENNLFLYPVVKDGGGPGINAALVNFNDGQDFESMHFARNAFYATSPIVNRDFGARAVPGYPHRHPAGGPPWVKFDWRKEWLDQVYPVIVDWGLPSMRALAPEYRDIGARASYESPIGVPGMIIDNVAPSPIPKEAYPRGTPFYGWEGDGGVRPADSIIRKR